MAGLTTLTPGATKHKQLIGASFAVKIDGGIEGKFTDAGGLVLEIEVVNDDGSNTDSFQTLRPGRVKYTDITLKRRLSPDKKFYDWITSIRDGKDDFRRNGSITMHDITGKELVRWNFTNAWPSKWSASDPDIGSDDPITEEITLAIEKLERVK